MSKAALIANPEKTSKVIESLLPPHEERSAWMNWVLIVLRFMSILRLLTRNTLLGPKRLSTTCEAKHLCKSLLEVCLWP